MDSVVNPASRSDPGLAWFAEARFGMFIHFSLASMFGEDLGYQQRFPGTYREYEALASRFDPGGFRAADWVGLARDAGCRYVTLVAKHWEGFCLWDTDTTGWKITNTPFGRDIVREVADECHARGMRICLYVNEDDAHSRFKPVIPGNWGDRTWRRDDEEPSWDAHAAYLRAQTEELLTRYGRIDGIWFDGTNKSERHWRGREHYAHIKGLQPHCVVNDRAGWGDFLTPEWGVEEAERLDTSRDLAELCVSVYGEGWGYRKDACHRSARECVDLLVRCAGSGVNLLLNVAPGPDGVISREQADRMRAVGRWLEVNGEAIYGTEPARLRDLPASLRVTRRGNDWYVICREWPPLDVLDVPAIRGEPSSARLLGSPASRDAGGRGRDAALDAPLVMLVTPVTLEGGALRLTGLPAAPPDASASVIHLRFDSPPPVRAVRPRPVTTTVVPVAEGEATHLPVTAARLEGVGVKGWRHTVSAIEPPDAAFERPPAGLPDEADQPYGAGASGAPRRLSAILDWRRMEQSTTWTLDVPVSMRARLRMLSRSAEACAGSTFEVRCGRTGAKLVGRVAGVKSESGRACPDWWKGFHWLPFEWQDVGELELPRGLVEIAVQPVWIEWGCFFADVAAMDLAPVGRGEGS